MDLRCFLTEKSVTRKPRELLDSNGIRSILYLVSRIVMCSVYGVTIFALVHDSHAAQCSDLSETAKLQLIRFVSFEYKVTVPLRVESGVQQDCFIRARVRSADPDGNFVKVLTISPDQRYVMNHSCPN